MIIIKTKKEIDTMRQGGRILAKIMAELVKEVKPGITTGQLERRAVELIKEAGGRPAFLGYKSFMETKAFPTALCTSINQEVVHAPALPSRSLQNGDIIGLDLGMEYPFGKDLRGYYTDMAVTVPVGKISLAARNLIKATKKSLMLAIKTLRPETTLSMIGRTIEQHVRAHGLSVVRDLVGHGVGTAIHEDPQVPNFEIKGRGRENSVLRPGMTLAIEPMVNAGRAGVNGLPDGFTIVTADGSLSAHFEHTVAVTKTGCDILTAL